MSAQTVDTIALVLLIAAAPSSTLFSLIFGLTSPWHRSWIGRALLTKAIGLALLVDISLAYHVFGANYQGRDAARLAAFGLVAVGEVMQFGALLYAKRGGGHLLKPDGEVSR